MRNLPLSGATIVVTGSHITTSILTQIQSFGGEALSFPLIETSEIIEPDDSVQLEMAKSFDWLIFTSQNAVNAFVNKINQHHLKALDFKGKIAAVGEKTAKLLEHHGFSVTFMPSIFSADVFVKEFPQMIEGNPQCLFIRGTKAKNTIKSGLPFFVKEWNVYETKENLSSTEPLIELVQQKENMILIFASPSAVEVYAEHIAPVVGWDKVQIAAIGHITEAAIQKYGVKVTYKPKTYTMQSVIDEIIKREDPTL
ncbi:uroporphyrinogen-III synthase [Lysinibacillus antri]|uniref:Uroporphyrinogen-III synthase n=1 Tax=Lysinibacillus antri TaxID=2498145 RepID=A0A432LAJ1_9BACI|nr:uroporphyrinogen-III synthase [Lysinibacillus antri]RUL51069.1 uroporphyrinogen-III synthase [Lysinibacillus antri]